MGLKLNPTKKLQLTLNKLKSDQNGIEITLT